MVQPSDKLNQINLPQFSSSEAPKASMGGGLPGADKVKQQTEGWKGVKQDMANFVKGPLRTAAGLGGMGLGATIGVALVPLIPLSLPFGLASWGLGLLAGKAAILLKEHHTGKTDVEFEKKAMGLGSQIGLGIGTLGASALIIGGLSLLSTKSKSSEKSPAAPGEEKLQESPELKVEVDARMYTGQRGQSKEDAQQKFSDDVTETLAHFQAQAAPKEPLTLQQKLDKAKINKTKFEEALKEAQNDNGLIKENKMLAGINVQMLPRTIKNLEERIARLEKQLIEEGVTKMELVRPARKLQEMAPLQDVSIEDSPLEIIKPNIIAREPITLRPAAKEKFELKKAEEKLQLKMDEKAKKEMELEEAEKNKDSDDALTKGLAEIDLITHPVLLEGLEKEINALNQQINDLKSKLS